MKFDSPSAGPPSFNFTGNTPSVINDQVSFNLSFSESVVGARCAVVQGQMQEVLEEVACEAIT